MHRASPVSQKSDGVFGIHSIYGSEKSQEVEISRTTGMTHLRFCGAFPSWAKKRRVTFFRSADIITNKPPKWSKKSLNKNMTTKIQKKSRKKLITSAAHPQVFAHFIGRQIWGFIPRLFSIHASFHALSTPQHPTSVPPPMPCRGASWRWDCWACWLVCVKSQAVMNTTPRHRSHQKKFDWSHSVWLEIDLACVCACLCICAVSRLKSIIIEICVLNLVTKKKNQSTKSLRQTLPTWFIFWEAINGREIHGCETEKKLTRPKCECFAAGAEKGECPLSRPTQCVPKTTKNIVSALFRCTQLALNGKKIWGEATSLLANRRMYEFFEHSDLLLISISLKVLLVPCGDYSHSRVRLVAYMGPPGLGSGLCRMICYPGLLNTGTTLWLNW